MDGRTLSDHQASVIPLRRASDAKDGTSKQSTPEMRTAEACPADKIVIGSEQHKALFCRMLLDTFSPYKPEQISWPQLDANSRQLLSALPIWDIAVQTEGKACLRVLSYGETIDDPLLQRALRLNAFEEARHKRVLNSLISYYGLNLGEEPQYQEPRDPEWAFMVTGFSECIDSFFAFGLFEACRRSGLFPPALAEAFEPVIQEEGRHILFFVNWVAWHRRRLRWWRRIVFSAKTAAVLLLLVWERIQTARDLGGNNFTMTGSAAVGIDLEFRELLDLCLAENDRRLAVYDRRLPRPAMMPRLARILRSILGCRRYLSRGS
jgi:hypothetical protein